MPVPPGTQGCYSLVRMPRRLVKRLYVWVHHRKHRWYLRVFGDRITDPHLWTLNRHSITAAFGFGVAIGFIPLPMHTLIAVYVALSRRLNLPVLLAGTWVNNPLTAVPMYFGAYWVGSHILGTPIHHFAFEPNWHWIEHGLGPRWKPFLLGCLVSAIACGMLARYVLELVWRSAVRRRYRARRCHRVVALPADKA